MEQTQHWTSCWVTTFVSVGVAHTASGFSMRLLLPLSPSDECLMPSRAATGNCYFSKGSFPLQDISLTCNKALLQTFWLVIVFVRGEWSKTSDKRAVRDWRVLHSCCVSFSHFSVFLSWANRMPTWRQRYQAFLPISLFLCPYSLLPLSFFWENSDPPHNV